jgi:hypothetical protein
MSTTETTNEAQRYSASIADEVRAIDQLLSDPYEKDLRAALLAELELDHLEETADGIEILYVWLNETILDVSVMLDTRPDTLNSRVVLLRTAGGPHCEITRDSNNGEQITVETTWGGEFGRCVVWAGTLAAYLDELAETHAEPRGGY